MADSLVTLHARLRWLERVEGHYLDRARRSAASMYNIRRSRVTDRQVVDYLLLQTERTVADLDAEILTPPRLAALKVGVRTIQFNDVFKMVFEHGRVVTIINTKNGYNPTKRQSVEARTRHRMRVGLRP